MGRLFPTLVAVASHSRCPHPLVLVVCPVFLSTEVSKTMLSSPVGLTPRRNSIEIHHISYLPSDDVVGAGGIAAYPQGSHKGSP